MLHGLEAVVMVVAVVMSPKGRMYEHGAFTEIKTSFSRHLNTSNRFRHWELHRFISTPVVLIVQWT